MTSSRLHIERLGHRGEGLAHIDDRRVFIPYALPGEIVTAEIEGDHARLIDIIEASKDRIAPICPHFGHCGGCAVQTLSAGAYAAWKRGLLEDALRNAGLAFNVAPLVDAHGAGRRRVTFHARFELGKARVGFMAARSHEVVEIDACPLLASELEGAPQAARALAAPLAARGKPLDIAITGTPDGLDVELRGAGPLDEDELRALIAVAETYDLARLTSHGNLVALRRAPRIAIGAATLALPPGAFLQATQKGEDAIAALVLESTTDARTIADLFCGVGAFALRLAARARVCAYDNAAGAIDAMAAAARTTQGLRKIETFERDLFKRPLSVQELEVFDALVFDPPRAGAPAQAAEIARSKTPIVIAVSCHAQSFARDAAILLSGGYSMRAATPIDQFRYAAHVEIVAVFARDSAARPRKRRLLG